MPKPFSKEQSTFHAAREEKPDKQRKPIKKVSDRRAADMREYKKLHIQFLSDNTTCAVTGGIATEVHHTYSAGNRDKYYLDTTTWMPVSREGHNIIHNDPIKSREKGWLK